MLRTLFTSLGAAALVSGVTTLAEPAEVPGSPGAGSGPIVALGVLASHPQVLAGESRDVYLYLALRAAELPTVRRPSMNLALVIDRSGSMASENKLRYARSAAAQLVGRLRPDDRLAIVAYDDHIRTVVPSTLASERDVFLAAIAELTTGGNTDLHGGMLSGYEQVLKHFEPERLNRVLLLSDGLANEGVTDPAAILARAAACRENGVRISTLGMGLSYDEDLMSGIAHEAGGNYFYVDEAESVGHYLDREIDQLTRLVARDLELRLELGEGVEFGEVFGYSHTLQGRTLVIRVNDMWSGERRKVVVRLRVRGTAGERRALTTTELHYVEASSRAPRSEAGEMLRVSFTDDSEAVALSRRIDVLTKVEVVHNAEALIEAMELQKAGRLADAQELLAARYLNSKLVNDTEYRSAELSRLLDRMQRVLLDLERTRSSPKASRDLQLGEALRGLGYLGED